MEYIHIITKWNNLIKNTILIFRNESKTNPMELNNTLIFLTKTIIQYMKTNEICYFDYFQ